VVATYCILGAGAVGGTIAARLAAAGEDVAIAARGRTLAALRERGLVLAPAPGSADPPVEVRPKLVEVGGPPADPPEFLILGMKSYDLPGAFETIRALTGPKTVLVSTQNGLPWWYFHGQADGPHAGPIESVDPGGRLYGGLDPARILGLVVYPGFDAPSPGVVRLLSGRRMLVGEPSGAVSERAKRVAQALGRAGFTGETTTDLRSAIWLKLAGNAAFSAVSALTLATIDVLYADPAINALGRGLAAETAAVAAAYGARLTREDVEQRIAFTETLGAFKTSMLQDLERGRPLEVAAIVGAVAELGHRAALQIPLTDAVHALIAMRVKQLTN
jgi:2-dehydropantoate 2-reductase